MTDSGDFPLIAAVKNGDIAIIRKCLSQGMNPNEYDAESNETPLKVAIKKDAAQIFYILLSSGAHIDTLHNYSSTLEFLFSYESYSCAKKFLASGYKLSKTESLELMNSPTTWGSLDALKIIVQSGYDLKNNRKPNRLISFAIELSWHQCIQYMLEHGLDPNYHIPDSGPLLIDALYPQSIRTRIVHILLEKGASANCTGKHKETPLMLAAQAGSLLFVKKLLAYKASCTAKDTSGRTAMDYADEQGFYSIASYLRDQMKKPASTTRVSTEQLTIFNARKRSYALLAMDKDLHGSTNGYLVLHKVGSRKTLERYLNAYIGRVRKGPFLLVQIACQELPQFVLRHHVHPPTRLKKLQTDDLLELVALIPGVRPGRKGASVCERYTLSKKMSPKTEAFNTSAPAQTMNSIIVQLEAILFVDEFGPYESKKCNLKR